jgi:hypothetical protein
MDPPEVKQNPAPRWNERLPRGIRQSSLCTARFGEVYSIRYHADWIPQTAGPDRLSFRLTERANATGIFQVFAFVEGRSDALLQMGIPKGPRVEHSMRVHNVGAAGLVVPPVGCDGRVTP